MSMRALVIGWLLLAPATALAQNPAAPPALAPAPAPGPPPPGYYPPPPPGYYPPPPPGYYPPPPPGYYRPPPPAPEPHHAAPAARTGFQMAMRLGVMFPAGATTGASGDSFPRRYSWQIPLLLGLGAKVTDELYLGTYLGVSFGGNGSDARVERACRDTDDNFQNDIACNTTTARIGLEAQYHFLPSESVNPWLGYGIGPELASQSITDRIRGRDENTTVTGWEYARLTFGLDLRPSRGFGLGPLLEGTLGEFQTTRSEINGQTTHTGSISNRALHGWVSLGLRFVLFP